MHDDGHSHAPDTLDPAATHELARTAAVAVWWQLTSFVEVRGEQAIDFLEGLATQHVAGVAPGSARYALFLTNKARIIAATLAYRVADDHVLLELDPALVESLVPHLRRYRLRSRCTVDPVEVAATSVVGPASSTHEGDGWFDSPAFGVPARTYLGTPDDVAARLAALDEPHADPEALDAVRIESGVPSLADLASGFMPAEVGGMAPAVALDKGCYLGQEPVARLHYRGHPNRTLRQVRLSAPVPADHGADSNFEGDDYLAIEQPADGRRVGRLTTWATSPSGGLVGMAVLRREVADGEPLRLAGTQVELVATSLSEAPSPA